MRNVVIPSGMKCQSLILFMWENSSFILSLFPFAVIVTCWAQVEGGGAGLGGLPQAARVSAKVLNY